MPPPRLPRRCFAERSRVEGTLYSHVFGRERVLVLQFERCRADSRGELRRTYAFFRIDEGFLPRDLDRVVNRAWRAKVDQPDDVVELLRLGYREDARALARDFPEIDLDLWKTLAV